MARSINKVILVGNLGKDAETQFTQSGTAVTRFSDATSRRWKDQQTDEWKEETNWTNVVLWKQEPHQRQTDLRRRKTANAQRSLRQWPPEKSRIGASRTTTFRGEEIGRASCRERGLRNSWA